MRKSTSSKVRFSTNSLKMVNLNAAGIDISATEHFVCVSDEKCKDHIQSFGTTSIQLRALRDWLKGLGVTTVAMESTGVYWIPLYLLLIESGFEVFLVNARFIKNVAGRPKTDREDCKWIWRLHTFGLLTSSFLPDHETFQLRTLCRHRLVTLQSQCKEVQHMQKALFQMNINLDQVINDITGKTGLNIIRAIVGGCYDPTQLATLASKRLKCTKEQLIEALRGQYQKELLFTLKQNLEAYDFLQGQIETLDKEIELVLTARMKKKKPKQSVQPPQKVKCGRKKKITFETQLIQACETLYEEDLTVIPGVGSAVLLSLISEVGEDFTRWPTEKHFCSWLGLSPSPDISAGKTIRNKRRKVVNRLAATLRMAGRAAGRTKTYLGKFYRKMCYRKGPKRATIATAHKIAAIIYKMVTQKVPYCELGEDFLDRKQQERRMHRLNKDAKSLGFKLVKVEAEETVSA